MQGIDLSGRVAVVTGGGGGIGRATALALSRAGAAVGVIDLDGVAARATVAMIEDLGGQCHAVTADVASELSVVEAIDDIRRDLGPPTILVTAAGIWRNGTLITASPGSVHEVLSVNWLGTLWAVRAVWGDMVQAGGGAIVTIGSVQGDGVYVQPNVYNSTKAAVAAMTAGLAVEGGEYGIRVNCVAPGPIATPGMGDWSGMTPEFVDTWRRTIPASRRGRPEEVAAVILPMCSPDWSYVNGAVVHVDGGLRHERRPVTMLRAALPVEGDPDKREE